jgi:hypothetical protein
VWTLVLAAKDVADAKTKSKNANSGAQCGNFIQVFLFEPSQDTSIAGNSYRTKMR